MRLSGRLVIVTGAASGIGRATSLRVASEGAVVGAIDIDEGGLASLEEEIASSGGPRGGTRCADVSDPEAITAAIGGLVDEVGTPLHAAFANAGTLTRRTTITDLDLDEWHRVLAVDLTGVLLTVRAAVPRFGPDGGSLLVCGSSLGIRPGVGLLPYVAAKAGVHVMARSLALEL
ncbi:MAG TPA: SDR family NAD(P)-dependent oxidoreductase, partial [Acidimicrobiales bacterium]|nr:SDR family NAD(P)-dependent oxidoreductase [Acidimicrobiales bacterium]